MAIAILKDRCTNCMLCVRDCTSGVFRAIDDEAVVRAPESCNRCGHCVAVCPRHAIRNQHLDMGRVRPVDRRKLDPEVFAEIIRSRRSVRHYKNKEVSPALIEKVLDLGQLSPTASNEQNVGYIVVSDSERLRKISNRIFGYGLRTYQASSLPGVKLLLDTLGRVSHGLSMDRYVRTMDYYKAETEKGRDFILHKAPVLLLLHAPAKSPFGCDNCNIAAANITNYAHALGLGTCYIGFLTVALRFDAGLRRWIEIPRGRKVFASLTLGYPAFRHANTVSRKEKDVRWLTGPSEEPRSRARKRRHSVSLAEPGDS